MDNKSTSTQTTQTGIAQSKDNSPNAGDVAQVSNVKESSLTFEDDELTRPYNHISSVTISLSKNYSKYREVNHRVMDKRIDYIGSSVWSSRILSSNDEEVKAYFPKIVGISFNNDQFLTKVKQYLNNIRVAVESEGVKINTSFNYKTKRDYLIFEEKMLRIEEEFARVDRSDISKVKKAVKRRIEQINALESTKYAYGSPADVDDYILYRHCLLYDDVCKDIALIKSDKNYRFYFNDDAKEAEKFAKHRLEVNRAKSNYVACLADDELFEAVYVQFCADSNLQVIPALAESTIAKEIKLDTFSTTNPTKFNEYFKNKDIKLIASIEKLIARGELHRSIHNQRITTSDDTFVGANMKDAVSWFGREENNQLASTLLQRLNNM